MIKQDNAMRRERPPFRADHVGSLLRTVPLKDARLSHARGEITASQLREIEDREITAIIRQQESVGLKLATDGEFRRAWWHFDFLEHLDGVERSVPTRRQRRVGTRVELDGVEVADGRHARMVHLQHAV